MKPRPSLAERTMETLSHLPSTPTLKPRASNSNFYEQQEPSGSTSRPVSRWGDRPGSSRRSQSSNPPSSQTSLSRPGSSSGPGQGFSNLRSQLPAIESFPVRGRTPATLIRTPSKAGLNGSASSNVVPPSRSRARGSRSRTPSPEKPSLTAASPISSKTVSARSAQPRQTVHGLLKKPSLPVLNKPAPTAAPRKGSTASQKSSTTASGEDIVFSGASSTSTQTAGTGELSPQFKKSSAALREQIAKAKAAKRTAAQQAVTQGQAARFDGVADAPVIPTDDTFDFGLTDDPFNLQRDAGSTSRVLQSRVATARTSGRLNIAAMGLKEVPAEVLNMYNLDAIGHGSWAESVDLTRFVAADNELEMIDESLFPDIDPEELAMDDDAPMCIFGGLETLDLHGNMLISLPTGLRRLTLLTSLNLVRACVKFGFSHHLLIHLQSSNRLANNCLESICQIQPLRDLKLGGNLLWGTLEPCFSQLINLEILDLHGNNLQSLPSDLAELHRLRILNIAENSFESLPFDLLAKLPLTQLNARNNKLSGILINDEVETLWTLQNIDVSSNQLTAIVRQNSTITMPALTQLCVSMNRIQALPDISSWAELITLTADENCINSFPDGLAELQKLKSIDFSSNDIQTVPAEVGRMGNLEMLRLSGNPLRDKKFVTMPIDEIKETLVARLAPPLSAMGNYGNGDGLIAEALTSDEVNPLGTTFESEAARSRPWREEEHTDDFATPPTSVPVSPARKRSTSMVAWEVKPGGVLDRSKTQSSSLHPVACSKLASNHAIRDIHLQHNLFSSLPESLSFFAENLTILSLAHNQLVGETYLGNSEELDFPALKELNLSNNHITSLAPLIDRFYAPNLEKLDISVNRIACLPSSSDQTTEGKVLRDAFPKLTILLLANNHLASLDPESIRGLKVLDATNNDIAHLNPRIGLLGGAGGLEHFEVTGNRFRVPRWNVLERGTEATLRWLRGRVPVADMAAWKVEKGVAGEEEVTDSD